MLEFLYRRQRPPERRPSVVAGAVGAALVRHDRVPVELGGADGLTQPLQIDGDAAVGRRVRAVSEPSAPRDVFVAPGGLGVPAIALVNRRAPQASVELWALDSPVLTEGSVISQRLELRLPAGRPPSGWQVVQAAALPRLQCLVTLRQDAQPRTALVGVIDLMSGSLRELAQAEPDPFGRESAHVAVLRASPDAVLVRWHDGRIRLGRWGDAAAQARVLLFSPLERDGQELLRLSLTDGNIVDWGLAGSTLWLQCLDGRLGPGLPARALSLDLARLL